MPALLGEACGVLGLLTLQLLSVPLVPLLPLVLTERDLAEIEDWRMVAKNVNTAYGTRIQRNRLSRARRKKGEKIDECKGWCGKEGGTQMM